MITEHSVQIDGLTMRFRRSGTGPAVVFVHGLLAYSFSWRKVMEKLENRAVFAVDMLGSGFSDCDPALDARLRSAADRLLRFLDAAGIERADLVGSSYGGTTVLMLACLHPERARTLTLVSPANPWSRIGRKRLAFLQLPLVDRAFPGFARLAPAADWFFIARMYGDAARLSYETVAGYSKAVRRPGVLEHAVKITQTWHRDMAELEDALRCAPEVPTLILWGQKDRVVDPASGETLAQKLTRAQIVTLPGLGHIPYEECPEEFVRPVRLFLDENSPAEGMHGK